MAHRLQSGRGEARCGDPGGGTVSPENGTRRACSRLGPSRHGSIRGPTARRRPNRCAAHREPFSCVDGDARLIPGLRKTRDTGLHRTARLADLVGSTWGPGPGKPSLVPRANPRWLLSCGLSLGASTPPHIADFSEPLHSYPVTQRDGPVAALHNTAGGSASRNGEARRERAGKAERSERRAREDYGWGWAGGVIKPNQPPRLATTPHQTSAAACLSLL